MSPADAPERRDGSVGACRDCLRRGWLLAELGALLDCNHRADRRLLDVLGLDDLALIAALGGRRRAGLIRRYDEFTPDLLPRAEGVRRVCRHDTRFPPRARDDEDRAALHVLGGVGRLRRLTARPVASFVGQTSASDYGIAVASSLARSLAAAGVTVAGGLVGGIGPAAVAGAVELDAPAVAIVGGGVDVGVPARHQALSRRLTRAGCAISELPCGAPPRHWTALGVQRLLAAIADVVLVVESDPNDNALAGARVAAMLGRPVAAVPGRITSRGARGPNSLLRSGARLVTGAGDVLDLIGDAERLSAPRDAGRSPRLAGLDPLLRDVLERVGAGKDTPGRLLGAHSDADELLRALGELELMGLLVRGAGGRYVAADPLAVAAAR
ncbi:MAG TPA: DNA-processing protein DprA [Solirubrobacteraceae bacterium]|nr:DNA-processing protein DprA [Solirubrobacteraceae bacterium]